MKYYMKEPQQEAEACVIWMHGLGADANDMAGLAAQLPLTVAVRHVFLDADVRPVTLNGRMPMRAWYDIVGMELTDREDAEGILQSEKMIRQAIAQQVTDGFLSRQIFLAGFSQGGAMALLTGLQSSEPLAGIIALSAYLPLASRCKVLLPPKTPMFIAAGLYDSIVMPAWTKHSADFLRQKGFEHIAWHEYPMEHSVCSDELKDLTRWLNTEVVAIKNSDGDIQ